MAIVAIAVDEAEFGCGCEGGDDGGFDGESDETHDDAVGVFEPCLRAPEDADERDGDKDVGDDGPYEPEAWDEIADIVERADICGLFVSFDKSGGSEKGSKWRKAVQSV